MMTQATEVQFPIYPDYQISAKHWHNPNGIPTLGMHGWLDNAATFDLLAPHLTGLDLVAIDFSGHGLSSHKPASCFFHILDLVIESFMVAKHLGWDQFAILGHSLGAAIGSYMAGTTPDRISHLMLLDGLGSLTTPAEQSPEQLARFLNTYLNKKPSIPPRYQSVELAAKARCKASPISLEGAKVLANRGTKKLDNGIITWRTDPRLLQPSAVHLTDTQTYAFLERITAQTLVIRPEPGFPFGEEIMKQRLNLIKHLKLIYVEGHHHAHLDTPLPIAEQINQFIQENS